MQAHERDKFYLPNVYSPPVQDLHNTSHGRLPGNHRLGEDPPPNVNREDYMKSVEEKADKAEEEAKNRAA